MNSVLFVEEDHALRSVFSEVLRNEGFTVLQAADLAEGLAACETHSGSIDVLIIDMDNGMTAARRLAESYPESSILFIGDAESRARLARAPIVRLAWLEKPFTSEALVDAVASLLKSGATRAGE